MSRIGTNLTPDAVRIKTVKGYLRELLTSSAVMLDRSLDSVTRAEARGVMETAANALSLIDGDLAQAELLITDAEIRARRIRQDGQDWKREIELYKTLRSAKF